MAQSVVTQGFKASVGVDGGGGKLRRDVQFPSCGTSAEVVFQDSLVAFARNPDGVAPREEGHALTIACGVSPGIALLRGFAGKAFEADVADLSRKTVLFDVEDEKAIVCCFVAHHGIARVA